jgi:hypothetical protein
VSILALIVVGLSALWFLGGVVLRLVGGLMSAAALTSLAFGNDSAAGPWMLVLAPGVVLWLAGHWHFAYKYRCYKHPLAAELLGCLRRFGSLAARGARLLGASASERPRQSASQSAGPAGSSSPQRSAPPSQPSAPSQPAPPAVSAGAPLVIRQRPLRWPARRRGGHQSPSDAKARRQFELASPASADRQIRGRVVRAAF